MGVRLAAPDHKPFARGAVQAILPIKEKYVFVNLTPHEIAVQVHDPIQIQNLTVVHGRNDGPFTLLRIPPEPLPARVTTVEGLPEPKPDTIFVVSGMVRDALEGRQDVLAPDTGKTAVRSSNGQVAYVTRLRGK